MSVYAISDLHGELPEWPSDATVALLAGDICPDFADHRGGNGQFHQSAWLATEFRAWLDRRPHGCCVVATWGNHDFIGHHPKLQPQRLPVTWLVDDEVTIVDERGEPKLRIWGTPWCPRLSGWAFYASPEAMRAAYDPIPEDLDILMSHSPPRGVGDRIPAETKYNPYVDDINVGHDELREAIAVKKPKVVICGHIHEARGSYELPGPDGPLGSLYNVAAVDENYTLWACPWRRLYEFDN